jgi:hypothetical protein
VVGSAEECTLDILLYNVQLNIVVVAQFPHILLNVLNKLGEASKALALLIIGALGTASHLLTV